MGMQTMNTMSTVTLNMTTTEPGPGFYPMQNLTTRATTTRPVQPEWLRCQTVSNTAYNDFSQSTVEQAVYINAVTFTLLLLMFIFAYFSPTLSKAVAPQRKIGGGFGSWLRPLLYEEDADGITIDGHVLIRFCRLGFRFNMVGSAVACVLLPMYAMSNGMAAAENNFLRYTTSNLDNCEWKFWVVVVAAYWLVFVFCRLMRNEWRYFIGLRRQHFVECADGQFGTSAAQAQYSLMIERIPAKVQHEEDGVKQAFKKLFNTVHSATVQEDTMEVHHLLAAKSVTVCCECCLCCTCCEKVKSSYDVGIENIIRLERSIALRIRALQQVVLERKLGGTSTSTAFITLTSLADRQNALQQASLFRTRMVKDSDFEDWVVRPGPEPRDIVWANASLPYRDMKRRCRLATGICFLGVLFWNVPILTVQAATTPATWERFYPEQILWMRRNAPRLLHLVTGYLPVIAIQGLLLLLPYALEYLSFTFEGRKQKSAVARKMLTRNLAFQMASLYLLAIGGSLWNSYTEIIKRPFCAGEILGLMIPKVSVYFLNFVIARIGLTLPMLIIRLWIIANVTYGLTSEEDAEVTPEYCWFGYEGTNIAIILVLANMYAVISPFIMPLCALYFGMASCIYRWLFINVYTAEFDGGGACWYELFSGSMVGLLLGVLTLCGVAGLRGVDKPAFFAMWALPLIVCAFKVRCEKYYQYSNFMPLEDAVSIDRSTSAQVTKGFAEDFYKDPIVKMNLDSGGIEVYESDEDESPQQASRRNGKARSVGFRSRRSASCDSCRSSPSMDSEEQSPLMIDSSGEDS